VEKHRFERESADMKRLIAVVLVSFVSGGALADMLGGWAAFEAGDYKTALDELTPLAEQGDADAQYRLARVYDAEAKPEEAMRWYQLSAKQGNTDAQREIGIYYEEGRAVRQDFLAAACWYRASAEQGNDKAQRNLADLISEGKGVNRDDAVAAQLYQASAAQGNAKAQRKLGYLYYFGVGVPQDQAKAAELFAASAEQGVGKASRDLGRLYYYGKGVEKDFAQAFGLFRIAAREGDGEAQFYLGRMYANGEGTERNATEAYFWLALANTQEPDRARSADLLRQLEGELSKDAVATAKQRAMEWQPE
jgi:hypothetical protein